MTDGTGVGLGVHLLSGVVSLPLQLAGGLLLQRLPAGEVGGAAGGEVLVVRPAVVQAELSGLQTVQRGADDLWRLAGSSTAVAVLETGVLLSHGRDPLPRTVELSPGPALVRPLQPPLPGGAVPGGGAALPGPGHRLAALGFQQLERDVEHGKTSLENLLCVYYSDIVLRSTESRRQVLTRHMLTHSPPVWRICYRYRDTLIMTIILILMMTLTTLTSVFELLTATRERVEAEGVLEGSAGSRTDGQRADLRRPGAGAHLATPLLALLLAVEEVLGGATPAVRHPDTAALGPAVAPLDGEPETAQGTGQDGRQQADVLLVLLGVGGDRPGDGGGGRLVLNHAGTDTVGHTEEQVLSPATPAVHELLALPESGVEGEPGEVSSAHSLLCRRLAERLLDGESGGQLGGASGFTFRYTRESVRKRLIIIFLNKQTSNLFPFPLQPPYILGRHFPSSKATTFSMPSQSPGYTNPHDCVYYTFTRPGVELHITNIG